MTSHWWYNLPLIGQTSKNINTIVRLTQEPCQVPPLIWATSLFPAALKAVLSYVELDRANILKARIGRPGVHGIGKLLPKLPVEDPTFQDGLGNALWEATGKWDEVGNFFFIAELGTGVVAEWMSTAYRRAGCLGNTWTAQYSALNDTFGGPANVWSGLGFPNTVRDPNHIAAPGNQMSIPPTYEGQGSVAVQFVDYFTFQPVDGVEVEIWDQHGETVGSSQRSISGNGGIIIQPNMHKWNGAFSALTVMARKQTNSLLRYTGNLWWTLEPQA
jgi:hypothetical protein